MPQRAHVTSVEAIEAFRSNVVIYLSKARPALEEVTADVMRTRLWIENEQRTYWENQCRRRRKELEQAQATLFSSKIGNLRKETAAEQMAVQRARRAVDEAETKLRVLKKWSRDFEGTVQPLVKQTEKLHTYLANDMVKAVASLGQTLNALAAYAEVAPPPEASVLAPPTAPAGSQATSPGSSGGEK